MTSNCRFIQSTAACLLWWWLVCGRLSLAPYAVEALGIRASFPPSVFVTKSCFRKGERIQVYFEGVYGIGTRLGLFPKDTIADYENLPISVTQNMTSWVLTCGEFCDSNNWPSEGTVQFSTADLDVDQYVAIISGDNANSTALAYTPEPFTVRFTCGPAPEGTELVASSLWEPPAPTDQRGPCPFINTLANHGIINHNGTFIDLFDMAVRLEAVYNVAVEFLDHGPVQLAIDCNQTYEDENGIIRLDLERLFDDRCEEHEASMVRADRFFGFEASKLVDDELLNNLMRMSPTSKVLRRQDVMDFQSNRIMDSRIINPETFFRPFDIDNLGAQGIFFFLMGTDPTLETVEKERLYFFLLHERLPDDFVPGALRETPFNFLDPTDFTMSRFVESMDNVEAMMYLPLSDGARPSVLHGLP
jgi:hypothetical protein